MSIASEITRLQNAKASIKTSIENKGVEVSSSAKLDSYSLFIDDVPYVYDYINTTLVSNTSNNQPPMWYQMVKKMPPITINGTSMNGCFKGTKVGAGSGTLVTGCPFEEVPVITNLNQIIDFYQAFYACFNLKEVDWSNVELSRNITSFNAVFYECRNLEKANLSSLYDVADGTNIPNIFDGCINLKEVDLSNFNPTYTVNYAMQIFSKCTSMEKIDMSSFDFSKIVGSTSNMFGANASTGVPDNCLILVKDQTQKNWINTNFSRLTNVQIKSEYLANQE